MELQYLQQIEEQKKQLDDGTLEEKWYYSGVPGYEVSNAQRVRNVRTGHLMTPFKEHKGSGFRRNPKEYIAFKLSVDGKQRHVSLHQMMCYAFNGPPPTWMKKPVVDHIVAEEIYDNRPENLRWMECGENSARGREKPVVVTAPDGSTTPFKSIRYAAKRLGLKSGYVCSVLKGRQKRHHGYAFEYAEEA